MYVWSALDQHLCTLGMTSGKDPAEYWRKRKRKRWLLCLSFCTCVIHGIKLLVFNKRMAMKLEASFSLTNINDSVKVIQLPLSKSIICGSQAPRSVWIIVIKYLQRGKISQFSCWKNVRACSSYDLTRGSYSLSPVLPGDVPITGGWWTRSNTMRNRKTDQLK